MGDVEGKRYREGASLYWIGGVWRTALVGQLCGLSASVFKKRGLKHRGTEGTEKEERSEGGDRKGEIGRGDVEGKKYREGVAQAGLDS